MVTNHIDNPHDTILIHDPHLRLYAIEPPLVEGDIIVGVVDGIVDHMSDDKLIAGESRIGSHRVGIDGFAISVDYRIEAIDFELEIRIPALEVLVDILEREIGVYTIGGRVDS